ncbi:hypothetical protein ANAEL_02237 [Anaerolineales bacterium]|nr:hypothetical protein ANAEL_02237 [Anaerolineales bacterium]
MKIVSKTTILALLTGTLLISCNSLISAPRTQPTVAFETAVSFVETTVAETKAALPAVTPTTTPVPTIVPFPTKPAQQIYTDPEGRYIITFPADWKPTDKPNSFSGEGGFFETGYLPDMGYVSSAMTVYAWLANVEHRPEESSIYQLETGVVSTKSSSGESINYVIHETPLADPAHRFIYVKTGRYPAAYVYSNGGVSFSWLRFAYEEKSYANAVPPLSPEETKFWENAIPIPSNISVTEYPLPSGTNPNESDGLFQSIPKQAWPIYISTPTPHKTTLRELGYELREPPTAKGLPQLYRDGRILFDHVTHVSDIYRYKTDSGSITAFIVEIELGNKNYVIQNDAINALGEYAINTSAPVLSQGELLWARTYSDRVEVKKSNGDVSFAFTIPWVSYPRFRAWDGHWILEVRNFVIQDGEILNKKLGYQEIFNWGLVKDKPTYFFRKDSKVGISHDGQILPLQYQDVAHGLCCGPAQNNPSMLNDAIHFFGKRDGNWYYVVVKFK